MNVSSYRIHIVTTMCPKKKGINLLCLSNSFLFFLQSWIKGISYYSKKIFLRYIERKAYLLNTVKMMPSHSVRYNRSNNGSVSFNTWQTRKRTRIDIRWT